MTADAKLSIGASVGAAVNIEQGATVNIHVAQTMTGVSSPSPHDDPGAALNRAVGALLKCAQSAGCQPVLERISQTLYGTKLFKTLTLAQLAALQKVADELIAHAATADDAARAELTAELDNIRAALIRESQHRIAAERACAEVRTELASARKMLAASLAALAIAVAMVGVVGFAAHKFALERDVAIAQSERR